MSNAAAADVILRLLATSASDSNKGRRRRRSRQSSDEEISENEMSDRSDEEDEDEDDDDEGPVDEYDAEYFGDSKDRAELMAMNEVDREQILFERAKKRTVLLDHRQVAKRLKRQEEASRSSRKGSGSASRDSARRSTRAKDTKTGNTKALADLKKAQERKKARRSHSPEPRRRRKGSVDYSDKSESSSDSAEDDHEYDSEPEKKKSSSKSISRKPATFEELNSIRLGRDKLEKWCYSPFFKETVVGCFARVSIGQDRNRPVYRICEIVAVGKQTKIYALGATMTNVTLTLKHGKAEKAFMMDILSNSPFTEDEFRRYEITLKNDGVDMVTLDHVENKRKDIQYAREYVLTTKDVEQILETKKEMKQGRLNPIVHRTILEQQKMSQSEEDALETERRLLALKESELAQRDMRADKLDVWAKLNERNRTINRKEGRQAEERLAAEKKTKGAVGKDVDPFARRKTMPRLVYDDISSAAATPTSNPDSGTSSPQLSGANTPIVAPPTAKTVAATPAMPQSKLEEVIASSKGEFDIDIDLDDI
ncbi:RNA polymerase-associated protein rtf1 [Podila clonocystis]|nr:RNA polymerase-associated protein rtf1 [Podila clonocystis]